MDFQTNITAREGYNQYSLSEKLDHFWPLIENRFEEDWRVDFNGDLILEVDNDFLHRILEGCANVSQEVWNAFEKATGLREEHNAEARKWEWVNVPEELQGTYTIKGVYDASQRFINHARRYFFTQEGA